MTTRQRWIIALLATSISILPTPTVRGQSADGTQPDPHRPPCQSPVCLQIESFLISHYCGKSPSGNGPADSCAIKDLTRPELGIDAIAQSNCAWNETTQKKSCKQYGQVPSQIHAILIRELRRLGLPAVDDKQMTVTLWKSRFSGWSVAEASNLRQVGSISAFCQVIIMLDPSLRVSVLREVRRKNIDIDVPKVTTYSLLGFTDIDGDGVPDAILQADAYENHWLEVHSVRTGSPRIIFSGLGYYL